MRRDHANEYLDAAVRIVEEAGGDVVNRQRAAGAAETLLTEVGPVDITVPRDRDGSFAPTIVPKRARRLGGVEDR